jgi:hypothetical protein
MSALLVAHDIPGRLRLRLPPGVPAEELSAAIGALPSVISHTWSPRTHSLLVLYDPQQGDRDAIIETVARVTGFDVSPESATNGHAPALARPEPGALLAQGVRQLFGELDQRVQHASRGLIGLGGLFPVGLTAWAFAEVVRGRVAPLAWSSALWYAHGLFRDYQVPLARD